MSKYAWITDCHLDHLQDQDIVDYIYLLVERDNPEGIFITGDISNGKSLVYHLSIVERVANRPVYFVLGNHDYYGSDIKGIREQMHEISNISQYLKYMPLQNYIPITSKTALVGHDGWYDGLNGDPQTSRLMLNDWVLIKDFVETSGGVGFVHANQRLKDKAGLITVARKIAHAGVQHIADGIKAAIRYHKQIVILTHFPPFKEAHIYRGNMGDKESQPWYTSKLCGDMLLDAARAYPDCHFKVFCGHTHGKFDGNIRKNLEVHVGNSVYGNPSLAGMIEIE